MSLIDSGQPVGLPLDIIALLGPVNLPLRLQRIENLLSVLAVVLFHLKYGRHLFHLHRDIEFVTDELVYHFLSFLILSVHCPHLACSLLFYTHIVKSPEVSKDIFRDRKR